MAKFETGAHVQVIESGRIGLVESEYRSKVEVKFFDKSILNAEVETYKNTELIAIELPPIKTSHLRGLVRGELSYAEVSNGTNLFPYYVEKDSEPYAITAEDILAGINVYEGRPADEVYPWLHVMYMYEEDMSFRNNPWGYIMDKVTEKDILNLAYDEVDELLWMLDESAEGEVGEDDFKTLRRYLETWIHSNGKDYPDEIKHKIAFQYDEDSIDDQSEATRKLFKKCLDYLCDELKDPKAIQSRGYCYYCGTKIYPNDWVKARDSFIEYYNMTGDASAANTLGYIYYYGRCNNGVPEYEEAFKYFSIGHAFTYYESTYKLADMFAHGYGVVKDGETAHRLYWSVYKNNLKDFIKGEVVCKFADAALRMGNCYRDGIGVYKDLETAYAYYLQADYAIRERIQAANHYGDNVVYTGIQKALASVREEYTAHGRTVKYIYPDWVQWALIKHRRCKMSVKELKDGALALDVSPMKRYDEAEAPKMLITIPKADYCELKKKLRIRTSANSSFESTSGKSEIIFDHIDYDWVNNVTSFYLFEDLVGKLHTDFYTVTAPAKKKTRKSGEQYHFVSVVFEGSGRTYDYLCEDRTVAPGDKVVVKGYDGEKAVEVVDAYDKFESELGLPVERYKHILRRA